MDEAESAIKKFMHAQAGVKNAQMAISTALAELPILDPQRVYVAGHSSAATLALLVAANDKRVKGCIAYAPCVDVPGWIGAKRIVSFTQFVPGFDKFLISN